jgi:centromere/kinetochore protein ZW10
MSTQRIVLNDLLGGKKSYIIAFHGSDIYSGTQNFLQQSQSPNDENAIEGVLSLIKALSSKWENILSKSAWAQATGSLLSTVAAKIILDVQDLTSLSADEAYRIANLISRITQLDDLFLPENKSQQQVPLTSQYTPHWLKLHYLSEVLQSNLNDVSYLWFDGELSLFFTAQEAIDLIGLSFESNDKAREIISRIKNNPCPKVMSEDM